MLVQIIRTYARFYRSLNYNYLLRGEEEVNDENERALKALGYAN